MCKYLNKYFLFHLSCIYLKMRLVVRIFYTVKHAKDPHHIGFFTSYF